MRFYSLLRKTLIENVRDWKVLLLILALAPFFVIVMHYYFESAEYRLRVTVINHDRGARAANDETLNAGRAVIALLASQSNQSQSSVLLVQEEEDEAAALRQLADRRTDIVVEIPEPFTQALLDYSRGKSVRPVTVKTYADSSNPKSLMAAAWSDATVFQYVAKMTGFEGPLDLQAETIGAASARSEYDLYVPALLALALMGLIFTAASSLIREKDKGTLIRLRLSNMTTFEWLSAVTLTQVVLGLLAFALTYLTAFALGYRGAGSWTTLFVITVLSTVGIVAVSIVVAAVLRTIFDLMTVGCFPYFLLMFFSGGMFPLPDLPLFSLGGRTLNANHLLPTTHTISALNKVLNRGAGLSEIIFELGATALLAAAIFVLGAWLFSRRHMRAR